MASSSDESEVGDEMQYNLMYISLPLTVKYFDADMLVRVASAHFGLMNAPGREMLRRVHKTASSKCAVCLGKVKKTENHTSIIVICCGNRFHKKCFADSVRANGKCPCCRAKYMGSRGFSSWASYLGWVAWSEIRRREEAWSPVAACTIIRWGSVDEGESLLVNWDGLMVFRGPGGGVREMETRRLTERELDERRPSESDLMDASDGERDIGIRMRNVNRQGNSFVGVSVSGDVYAWDGDRIRPGWFDSAYISAVPKQIEQLHDIVFVAVGVHHCIAVSDGGLAFTWGYVCNLNDAHGPRFLEWLASVRVRCAAAGAFHFLVVTEEGQLYTFGDNRHGQLGHGLHSHTKYTQPKLVDYLKHVRIASATAGNYHSLALTEGGLVLTWGMFYGRDANPNPTLVKGALESVDVRYISAGGDEWASCAVCAEGKLYTWGCGNGWRLEHGDEENVDSPRRVEKLHCDGVFVQVCSIGFDVALAVVRGGNVFLWGRVNPEPSVMKDVLCSPGENGRFPRSARVNSVSRIQIAQEERVALLLADPRTAGISHIVQILSGNSPVGFKADVLVQLGGMRYYKIIEYINEVRNVRVDFIIKPLVALLIRGDDYIKVLVMNALYKITYFDHYAREEHVCITDSIVSHRAIAPLVSMICEGNDGVQLAAVTVLCNIAMNCKTHLEILQPLYRALDVLLELVGGVANREVRIVAGRALKILAKTVENRGQLVQSEILEGLQNLSAELGHDWTYAFVLGESTFSWTQGWNIGRRKLGRVLGMEK